MRLIRFAGCLLLFTPNLVHAAEGASRLILRTQCAAGAAGGGVEGLLRAVLVGALLIAVVGAASVLVRRDLPEGRDEIPHW